MLKYTLFSISKLLASLCFSKVERFLNIGALVLCNQLFPLNSAKGLIVERKILNYECDNDLLEVHGGPSNFVLRIIVVSIIFQHKS